MRSFLVYLQIVSGAASCMLKEINVRKLKSFEALRKQFEDGEIQPTKLLGVTEKWDSLAWSWEELVGKFGDVEVWPRDLREVHHSNAPRLNSSTVRQFLSEAAPENAVFETRFCSASRVLEDGYKVPRAFQRSVYTMPILGLSRSGTGVGYHTANAQMPWGSWVAQVHGSTMWALRPAGHKGQGVWPWPWQPAVSHGVATCTLQPGDAIFIPGRYERAWLGNGETNVFVGWQGPETAIPQLELPMSAITKGDVQGFKKAYESMADSSAKDALLTPCVNHAVSTGHIPILRHLHDMGAKFDEEDPTGFTALHAAASQGQADGMLFALQRGADPKVRRQQDGLYPIHMAAHAGHVEALKVLLSRRETGWKLKDRTGKQALHMSATQGHTAAVGLLLAHRANINARDGDGFQALHWATESDRVPVLDVLLHARADIEARNTDGETSLYRAAIVGHVSALERLTERRALLNAKSTAGRQAVHAAAYVGHLGILQALHQHGADLTPERVKGQYSPEGLAASAGHKEVLQFLQRAGGERSGGKGKEKVLTPGMSISAAVQAGHVAMLDSLLEKLPDRSGPEYRLNLANDSLHYGHVPILDFLVMKDSNKTRSTSMLLLPFAVKTGNVEPVEYLLRNRAEVNKPPLQGGDQPLLLAAAEGHLPMVKTLLKHKANTEHKSHGHNLTAMHLAVMQGKASLIKTLLKGGAQMKIGDDSGREHLHVAAAAGHKTAIAALLDSGADVMVKDVHGAPPTFLAAKEGHQAALRLLAERRADLSFKLKAPDDESGGDSGMQATALSIAAAEGHITVLKFLLHGYHVKEGREIVSELGKQHGKEWQQRLEAALEFDRRSETDLRWKEALADPEKAEKMKQFSDMYRKLSPSERRALDKKLQDQAELEEATKSYKEKEKMKRVSRPAAEL